MYLELDPAQRVTVAAVGGFAYKHSLHNVPRGIFAAELVLEPDNPHDRGAISVRYQGSVIAYIPRDRAKTYWQTIARVQVAGYTATTKAVLDKDAYGQYVVRLYLLSGKRALPPHLRNTPTVKASQIQPAYTNPQQFTGSQRSLGVETEGMTRKQKGWDISESYQAAPHSDWLPTAPAASSSSTPAPPRKGKTSTGKRLATPADFEVPQPAPKRRSLLWRLLFGDR